MKAGSATRLPNEPDYLLLAISEKISWICLTNVKKSELLSTVLSANWDFLSTEI